MSQLASFDKPFAEGHEDREREDVVRDLWQHVVRSMLQLLDAHHVLGFAEFHLKVNPTVPEMKMALRLVDTALDALTDFSGLTHQAYSDLENSKKTIFLMRRVFASLEQHNEDEYKDCIVKLQAQKL